MKTSISRAASTCLFAGIAMLATTVCPPAANAAILSVGSMPDCTHANLPAAVLASQPGDEIHIVSGPQPSNQVILGNSNLHIVGGYANCAAANPDVGVVSELSPAAALGQPFIFSFSGSDTVLENIEISGVHTNSGLGGAIRVSTNSRLAVANVRIRGNSALAGAGIMVAGTLEIIAGTDPVLLVENNTATRGGGLFVTAQGTVIAAETARVDLTGNTASVSGGGIYLERYGNLGLTHAVIDGNTAIASGGGIHVDGGLESSAATPDLPNVTLGALVTLSNNSSDGDGGGLYAGPNAAYHVAFAGTASSNTANRGGAMSLIRSGRMRMTGSELHSNSALTLGGGLSIQAGVRLEIGASNIHDNTANRGGGLAIAGSTLTALPSSIGLLIHDNTAAEGGGIAVELTSAATFDGDCGMGGCQIFDNVATGRGGGLYSEGYPLLVGRGWTIDGNMAIDGGGIALRYGRLESADAGANDSLIVSNNNATNGGGIHVEAASVVLRSTRIGSNHASASGGGMHLNVDSQEVSLANSRFIDNIAGDSGGAVYAVTSGSANLNLHVAGVSGAETLPVSDAACNGDALPANQYCSEWRGNRSESHSCGEVLYLSGQNLSLNWEATALLDSPTLGAALCLDVVEAQMRNSLIAGNESGVFFLHGDGSRASNVTLESISAIDNTGSVLDHQANWVGNLTVQALISRDNGATVGSPFDAPGTFFQCNFSDDGALAGDTRDPLFESTYRGDWRLTANSPARAACQIFNHVVDQDGFERPVAPFDAGAFGWHPQSDRIFGDGFD